MTWLDTRILARLLEGAAVDDEEMDRVSEDYRPIARRLNGLPAPKRQEAWEAFLAEWIGPDWLAKITIHEQRRERLGWTICPLCDAVVGRVRMPNGFAYLTTPYPRRREDGLVVDTMHTCPGAPSRPSRTAAEFGKN